MSTTIVQQLLPPPIEVTHQAYTTHSSHGSVGPVIAVLAVITVLGVIAAMIGRLCSGHRIMGYGDYDIERWVETKCSSCVDGRITPHPPPRPASPPSPPENNAGEVAPSVELPQEEERQQQQTRESSHGNSSN
ncbi:hypothetical protein TanjilG_08817 [Lupinus angustifolius]|uniref:Uncharacterized protein n=1 Tax=Lupinus angustifolius TaxID=3871 RepID=A0A4P1RPL7_LUPAN|nr:PREDICTED: uncharacterized protein LOC109342395 [Lupinus angustifolius]OIW15225.1 hypothetical protein TanjilG_08817 [Lupinus angustifolius]